MKFTLPLILLAFLTACSSSKSDADYLAHKTSAPITLDGIASEDAWEHAQWHQLDQRWLGKPYNEQDFSGKFKLTWDENYLYLLAEITDDTLFHHYEGTEQYWNNDILEIFVDEDASGGNHQYNYNAFAYHIDKNYDVFDIAPDSNAYYFNDHVDAAYAQNGNTYTWETAIKIYDNTFERGADNTPVELKSGKLMGFALAYCDNDTSEFRENFIGSEAVAGEDKNRGWIDADIFGKLKLLE